jgi:hypothetical protein
MKALSKPTNTANMTAVQLSKYTPKSYIERVSKGIVNYGEKNDFPEYLISLFYGSPTHGAVTKTKAQMIFGNGFAGDTAGMLKVVQLNLNDVSEKCALDFVIQGGFCLEVRYSLDRTGIAAVKHVEFERVRVEECDEDGNIEYLWYCDDWTDGKKLRDKKRVKSFDPAMKDECPVQFLYVRPFTAGLNHYPKPDYLGAVNYIELEQDISEFLINHINNGMSPSTWLHFLNGEPDDDEKRKIERDIKDKYSGSENAGSIIITYSDGQDRKPHIDQVEISDAPKQWEFISTHVTDKILIAHRVTTPVLFGVKEAGQLGATQELETGARLFEMHVIAPMRRHINDAFNIVLMECGVASRIAIHAQELFTAPTPQATPQPTPQALSKDVKMEKSDEDAWMKHLEGKGEHVDMSEWEVLYEEDVDGHESHDVAMNKFQQLAFFDNYANPQDKSDWGDSGLFKLRYKYEGGVRKNSRDFCRVMMRFSNEGLLYRYEDIATMSDRGVNGNLAPAGESSYDLFMHKGGAYCHHNWRRVIFFRKTQEGRFLPKSKTGKMENDTRVGNNPNVPQKGAEGTRPIDTPTRGKLNLSVIVDKILGR